MRFGAGFLLRPSDGAARGVLAEEEASVLSKSSVACSTIPGDDSVEILSAIHVNIII